MRQYVESRSEGTAVWRRGMAFAGLVLMLLLLSAPGPQPSGAFGALPQSVASGAGPDHLTALEPCPEAASGTHATTCASMGGPLLVGPGYPAALLVPAATGAAFPPASSRPSGRDVLPEPPPPKHLTVV